MSPAASRRAVLRFASVVASAGIAGCSVFEDHPELILRNIRDGPISATVEMVALETGATVLSHESKVDPVDQIEWQLDLTGTPYRISTTLQDGSSKSRQWTWGEQSNYMDIVVWDDEIEYMVREY